MTDEIFSIGQLSALTGIKTITLRAWERRYGLLVPTRRDSGHRTYSQADVDKIREIRFWLEKGVSIGKVKNHLKNIHTQKPSDNQDLIESLSLIKTAAINFNQANLKHHIDNIFALYPIDFFIDQILPEIIHTIGNSNPVSLGFFKSLFRHKLRESILSAQHSKNAQKLLIARSELPYRSLNVLSLASILSVYDYNTSVIEQPVYIEHIPTIMEQGNFDSFVLFTNDSQTAVSEVKKIASKPWLKVIASGKPDAFSAIEGVTPSGDTLNNILEILKNSLQ